MSNDFSEDLLIQKSTAEFLEKELGWKSVFAYDNEVLGEQGTLGRKGQNEVVLTRHLRMALKRLNPWMSDKQLTEAIDRMTGYMSSQTLMQINEEKYRYLRDGVPVTIIKPNGETEMVKAKVVDFADVDNNEFIAVRELWIKGPIHKRRADVIGFVNGLPLIFMELKNHDQDIQNAYTDNYCDYLDTITHLFHHNAVVILSNGMESRVGTIESKWEFFHEWKRLTELDHGNIELPTMLRGICKKENLLDILENFILFDHSDGNTVKILARNHQYLGVNQAVEMYRHREDMKGKLGVFWHTQGSGKSYSMVFLAQKIRRKFEGSPTIVVLMHLSQSLSEEEERYVREGFKSDEKLSLYDLLLKDNLTKSDIKKPKNVAIDLLAKIKEQLSGMDHPFDKPATRAALVIAIRDMLWNELPDSYSEENINHCRDTIYNYVSQRYGGVA